MDLINLRNFRPIPPSLQFCIANLEVECEKSLCWKITPESVYNLYNFAHKHHLQLLKSGILEYISENLLAKPHQPNQLELRLLKFDLTWEVDNFTQKVREMFLNAHIQNLLIVKRFKSECVQSPLDARHRFYLEVVPCGQTFSVTLNYESDDRSTSENANLARIVFSLSVFNQTQNEIYSKSIS